MAAARVVPGATKYLVDSRRYAAAAGPAHRFPFSARDALPRLGDASETTGFDRHYVFHTAWAARAVRALSPSEHYDIASSLYFASLVSAFVPVRFFDYRPAELALSNLSSEHADLLALPFASGSIQTLSCMHVVEHIGLGRYGEPIDPDGDLRAIAELKRVVAPGGSLLFVVPVGGRPRLMFNAHRIYSIPMVLDAFADAFALRELALIPDDPGDGDLVPDPPETLVLRQEYACACFRFEKHPAT